MLALILLSFLALLHQSLGSGDLNKLLKKHPTWSFELTSVETILNEAVTELRAVDPDLKEDQLRAQLRADFGPERTHIVRKVGDPKWSKSPPPSFDAREEWKQCAELINDVQDEGACFTDVHTFAASVAADRYCIHTNGTFKENFSAQWLAGCAARCTKKDLLSTNTFFYIQHTGIPTGGPYKSKKGCLPYEEKPCRHSNESSRMDVGNAWKRKFGHGKLKLCEELMTYDHECAKKCSNPKYPKSLDKDLTKFTTWYYLTGQEFHARNEILAYGPVAAGIRLYNDFFQYPANGMYRHQEEETKPVRYRKYVKLIGWGEEEGNKYWLAVNSWDDWGDTKVFKIPRGENHVSVEWLHTTGVYEEVTRA